ncbi:MAG: hypothetical protein HS116_00310 [Planctomycetes bacterium]|nr:hypothetical protein [Planctomycetota bacterium]
MTPDQIEKAISVCQDLQAHALNEIVQSVRAGRKLTPADHRVIRDLRRQFELKIQEEEEEGSDEELNADSSATSASTPSSVPTPVLWLPLPRVAQLLNVNPRTLQLWCKGSDESHQPPMPCKREGRTILLQTKVAYAHLLEHASHLPGMKPPPEEVKPPCADVCADGLSPVERLEEAMGRLYPRLLQSPVGLRVYSQTLKILEDVKAQQREQEALLKPEDAIKMLRSLGELYVEVVDGGAVTLARRIEVRYRELESLGMTRAGTATQLELEDVIREWANDVIEEVRRHVDEQVEEVGERTSTLANAPVTAQVQEAQG